MQSDTDLAARAAKGEAAAFETLVRRHQATVRGLTRRLAKRPVQADDIAQAAFMTAWRKIGSYAGGSFKAWLCQIAYREFLQANRKIKPETEFDESAHIIAFDTSAARMADRIDLDRALGDLPESQRVCVVMCVAAGLSHSEAARATGWPIGTVKSHVTRGITALRKHLATENVA